ncbi:MAG: response regulator transcription factor [Gaiellaceae bacterium]
MNELVSEGRVLVVDDEQYIRELVSTALRFSGFDVEAAEDGFSALRIAADFDPQLFVLDVSMPGIDGLEVCRRLREAGDTTPVVFLTARDSEEDKLAGFTGGGDDYVTKPFSLDELVARIRAVLRRASPAAEAERRLLTYSDVEMDEDAHRVTRAGVRIELSPTEYKLLRYLLLNAEQVLSKAQILEQVWQYDFGGEANAVETYISYLRKKIDARGPKLIHTVRGFGYALRLDP